MRPIQLVIILVALGAAGSAGLLAMKIGAQKPQPAAEVVESRPAIDLEEVLVAARDIGVGTSIGNELIGWKEWPKSSLDPSYIVRSHQPDAMSDLKGMMARAPILAGEPVRTSKLIRSSSGYLSAVLPRGMRAVAVKVNAVSTAGGFILPEDRVDVMLVRQKDDNATAETIMSNIRVLAIDQTIEQASGDKRASLVAQNTATLELTPEQSELVVQAQQIGTISLALRSLADANTKSGDSPRQTSGVSVVKYGIVSRVNAAQQAN